MTDYGKVISTFQFTTASQAILREAGKTDVLCIANREEFLERLKEAEILCSYWVPNNWRALAPNLRWLQASGAGVDGLRPSGILNEPDRVIVTTAVGIHASTIGEYVFGSMLMFNRTWPEMVRLQDRHVWPHSAGWYKLGGRELVDQTLGIVGLGSIGRRIAQLGHAFGMRVLATRRSVEPGMTDPDVDQLYPMDHLQEMLRHSDYVVLSVPLTPQTEKLIGEPELRAMQPHAYLVNVARGQIIDEKMLIRALKEGWIAGAGLDVTQEEPLPASSPLFSLPNVILTPHISGDSVHYDRRLTELFANNLRRYRAGEPMINRYDPARGY
ncbi:hydroxyacid dehydrogenase [Dictyobacter sp. S3.2.2.5]|uniref:Hydroxyacid dehydrogenase n=1 Tax=Dictyobacter halimunensis TaxID=3026934 RepID=A0ABQ6FWU2_9CHLR|nr:hydroxyacid dehydrogenase [Dictyobacter sp. S3.2.2.5]